MTIKIGIKVDPTRCDGFGDCVMAAPDIFALGDDGRAKLIVREVGVQRFEEVRRAAYNCPASAIEFKEE
jgi:ferredoxin